MSRSQLAERREVELVATTSFTGRERVLKFIRIIITLRDVHSHAWPDGLRRKHRVTQLIYCRLHGILWGRGVSKKCYTGRTNTQNRMSAIPADECVYTSKIEMVSVFLQEMRCFVNDFD